MQAFSKLGSALVLTLTCGLGAPAVADIVKEGDGPRRADLDAMERQALDPAVWTYLSGWTGEAPLTEADMAGKVVLICTWAKWYPQSMRALPLLDEIVAEHTEDDVIILAVHHPRSFDAADAASRAEAMKIHIAHDTDGKFREALRVDQDPDFYLIDRAGQLRYADVTNASIADAVDELVAESRDDAASLNDRLAQAASDAERDFRQTDSINQDVDLRTIPDVPFTPPEPQAFTDADWPSLPVDPNSSFNPGVTTEPAVYPGVNAAEIRGRDPLPSPAGRVLVFYFWHPDYPATHEKVIGEMDQLQKAKGRDLIVIGVLNPFEDTTYQQDTRRNDPARLGTILQGMITNRRLSHWMYLDMARAGLTAALGNQYGAGNERTAAGYCAIVSTDLRIRWHGSPRSGNFKAALDQVLRVDPGIQARREAEAEYIRTRSR